jgi:hypothetical protein
VRVRLDPGIAQSRELLAPLRDHVRLGALWLLRLAQG